VCVNKSRVMNCVKGIKELMENWKYEEDLLEDMENIYNVKIYLL